MKSNQRNGITRRGFVQHAATITALAASGVSRARGADNREDKWEMKLATSSVMFDRLPIEKVCETAANLGLTGIDIWAPFSWGGAKCTHLEDVKQRLGGKGLRELLTRHKLEIAAFTIYGHQLSRYSELIGDFGGGIVVHGANARSEPDPKRLATSMAAFFEKLKPEIELAEKCNARIAIENHGGSLLNTYDSFKAFVEMNPNPKRVGIALAPYHLQGYKTPMVDFIKTAGSQCLFFYAWQRGKDTVQMPGVGPADFKPWLAALAEIDYAHYSSIFMHGHPATDAMKKGVAESKKYLLKCL